MGENAEPKPEAPNLEDAARRLLAEFVGAWDQQFPPADHTKAGEFAPLLADLNRLIRRARALAEPAAPS